MLTYFRTICISRLIHLKTSTPITYFAIAKRLTTIAKYLLQDGKLFYGSSASVYLICLFTVDYLLLFLSLCYRFGLAKYVINGQHSYHLHVVTAIDIKDIKTNRNECNSNKRNNYFFKQNSAFKII